jgi:replication-associated recombination protein RarA
MRRGGSAEVVVVMDDVRRAVQKPSLQYDKSGDEHYNAISAFHKSIRGCDPQVFWPNTTVAVIHTFSIQVNSKLT